MKKENLQQVTLLCKHTHAGVECQAGEKIRVSTPVKNWLIANNVVAQTAEKTTEKSPGGDE